MFKQYLRVHPAGMQFTIFITLWIAFSLLFSLIQPLIVKAYGIKTDNLTRFLNNDLFRYPDLIVVINAAATLFLFFIPAALFAYLADPKPIAYLGLKKPARNDQAIWIAVMCIGMIPTITIIGGLLKELNLGLKARELNEQREAIFNTYLKTAGIPGLLKNLFFLALLPAVSEELFFRGILQKFAHTWFKKPALSILLSGILFALMHFSVYEFIPILIAGIALAWVYYITSSLWLPVLLHFLNNGLQIFLVFLVSNNPGLKQLDNTTFLIIAFIGGALILTFAIRELNKRRTPLPAGWSVVAERGKHES